MSRVPDNVNIRDLSLPGTHESCALYEGSSAGFAHCQNRNLQWQLTAGVRFLDIRCRAIDGAFAIHHGPFYQQLMFGDVLSSCYDFLRKNPSETILMKIQQEYSEDRDEYLRIFRTYMDDKGWRSLFHISRGYPSLGEARGKVVLCSKYPWVGEGLDFDDFDVQDDYDDPTQDEKKKEIVDQLNNASDASAPRSSLYVNHVSANGGFPWGWTPWSFASRLNPFTKSVLYQAPAIRPRVGVIAMDYVDSPDGDWDTADIDGIAAVSRLNEFRRPTLEVGKSYVIWNRHTGRAMDAGTAQSNVVQWTYDGLPQQCWTLEKGYADGIYTLRSERSGGLLSCKPGQTATHQGHDYHFWQIRPASNGGFHIHQDYAGLDLHIPRGSLDNGAGLEIDANTQYDWYTWCFDERVDINQSDAPGSLDIDFRVVQRGDLTYQGVYTLTNTGSETLTSWALDVTLIEGVTLDTVKGAVAGARTAPLPGDPQQADDKGAFSRLETVTLTGDQPLTPGGSTEVLCEGRLPQPGAEPAPWHIARVS
ncbi:phosphatidylinositol-specific phospholipase C domain-containing protein [Streptomyces sp. NPDC088341]|uniref:phosphatidylinositol-specific phospholipase C domain-containing protein n=1 Tax=Streptomyces sp. NPDC088341 TaxID=3154870 RepID=UPI003434978E